jgi:copper chaperone NosL
MANLKSKTRIAMIVCGVALLSVLVLPVWQIQLAAPQYPEGLVLKIYAEKLGGDVDVINGLNHYIGMRTLHTNDFIEFTVLKYIIVAFALLFFVTALNAKRRMLNATLIAFILFGIVAMVDFWRWEYNYGHNLDPDAAIQVPGMAYQPPLIGYKQLLNFGAYSIPDAGGWIFVGAGVILFVFVVLNWKAGKAKSVNKISVKRVTASVAAVLIITTTVSCNVKPQPFKLGQDNCYFCKMTVSDPRFGAELITEKGKTYKFDDTHCLLSFIKSGTVPSKEIKDIYLITFNDDHAYVKSGEALLLKSDALNSPMNGNVAAFASTDRLNEAMETFKGTPIKWEGLSDNIFIK